MKQRRKLVIRADDMGYSPVNNIGAFRTIEEGIVTSADIMLDCPGTEDALVRMKELPWISFGWHDHFWGSPVLDPSKVPSLYDKKRGGFREDLKTATDVKVDEALAELRAELERCDRILGRVPDTGGSGGMFGGPMYEAMNIVCEEYDIAHSYTPVPKCFEYIHGNPSVNPKWKDFKLYSSLAQYATLETDSLTTLEKYDPIKFFVDDEGDLLKQPIDTVLMVPFHPGYVDYFVYKQGDFGPNARKFILCRIEDVHALTSDRLKQWVRENDIELVGMRDALNGTRYYQNYHRAINSGLAVD